MWPFKKKTPTPASLFVKVVETDFESFSKEQRGWMNHPSGLILQSNWTHNDKVILHSVRGHLRTSTETRSNIDVEFTEYQRMKLVNILENFWEKEQQKKADAKAAKFAQAIMDHYTKEK